MPVNYNKVECQEFTSEAKFGICDDSDESPAYIIFDNEGIWQAVVINNARRNVKFVAIDKCIDIPLINGQLQSRCDAMLITDIGLYFVEIKNKRSDWKSKGIEQLEATIKNLISEWGQTFFNYRQRKAFVANKRHPNFHVIENETMERFRDLYSVRLDLQATIKL